MSRKYLLVIGTMDTKGREIDYLLNRIHKLIHKFHADIETIVLDVGILGKALKIVPDYTPEKICEISGKTINYVRDAKDRGEAINRMGECAEFIVRKLLKENRCHGIICLAGSSGAMIFRRVAELLPIGMPKIIASPLANGEKKFGIFIDTKDIMVMHSVFDIMGISAESRKIFDQLAGAIVGAMISSNYSGKCKKAVGITLQGNTSQGAMYLKEMLEREGFDVLTFHTSGIGGRAMENMAKENVFKGVIDYTTNEIFEDIIGGEQKGCGKDRMTIIPKLGIPQVVVPGAIDYFDQGPQDTIPDKWKTRKLYQHVKDFTLVRLTGEELFSLGKIFAEKLNFSVGEVSVVVPLLGFSIPDAPGGPFEDRKSDYEFVKGLRENLRPDISIYEINAHINDYEFAKSVFDIFMSLLLKQNNEKGEKK